MSDAVLAELRGIVEWMDTDLDENVPAHYQDQPLAQDWQRVAKLSEEVGEVVDALIGMTAANPRKGQYATPHDVLTELADVALTGIYAIQHFTKNSEVTLAALMHRARHHRERREAQLRT